MISTSDIESLFLKEIHRYGLIPLCGNVHHIDTEIVLLLNIGSIFNEELDQIDIASKRCKMQSSKAIIICFMVDPLVNLLFCDCVISSLH
jgi:hypothetical protein